MKTDIINYYAKKSLFALTRNFKKKVLHLKKVDSMNSWNQN